MTRGSVIHSFAAVRLLLETLSKDNDIQKITAELLAVSCGSHHGLFDCIDENGRSGIVHRLEAQPEYDKKAIRNLYESLGEEKIKELFVKASEEIKPYFIKCKEIGRNKNERLYYWSLVTRLITSALINADRTDTARFMEPERNCNTVHADKKLWQKCSVSLENHLNGFDCNTPIQKARRAFSDLCEKAAEFPCGIYRLNLPTGGGKTLSGLRFALKHAEKQEKQRLFFISPLLSILDQNAESIRNAIKNDEIILEHHSDVLIDSENTEELERYDYLTETWDSPIVITTLVQFLNTLFDGKKSSVRRFEALCNSVIVIDEVQTVPTRMLTLFCLAMNFLAHVCKATVILCSATQPEFGMIEHPLIFGEPKCLISPDEYKKYEHCFKRNIISYKGRYALSDIPCLINELLKENNSVLVICNKKDEASALFSQTKEMDAERYHLSAGMCLAHRKEVLSNVFADLKSSKKLVCVSTQVIEAGIDISFDAVIRLSAGLDSIVQAAGRCNRNGMARNDAPVWIVDCSDESLSRLMDIKRAKDATNSLLYKFERAPEYFHSELSSDEAVSCFYNSLYSNFRNGFCDYVENNKPSLYSMLSDNSIFRGSEGSDYMMCQAFKTAGRTFKVFDENEASVIVPWKDGKAVISELCKAGDHLTKSLLDMAKPYIVSVFSYQFKNLLDAGALISIDDGRLYALSEDYYDPDIGIINKKEGEKKCNILMW